jgi:hypothetical protein
MGLRAAALPGGRLAMRFNMQTKPRQFHPGPADVRFIERLICLVAILFAIFGFFCGVVGLISLFLDPTHLELSMDDSLVQTTREKVVFSLVGAGLCLYAILSFRLIRRGRKGTAFLICAIVVALVLMYCLLTGNTDLISIEWRAGKPG